MSPNDNLNLFLSEAMPESKARMYSPLTLAFLGDAVYSLLVKQAYRKASQAINKIR